MCFAPQRRALFRHLNFQKWSEAGVFCTFWLRNVLRNITACTFSTSQLPKMVRTWCVLYILTSKCASRHNGVHFVSTSQLPKVVRAWCVLYILTSTCASRHNGVHFVSTSQLPKVVRAWCVLYILTSTCASRHNGAHYFDIATSKSGPKLVCFVHSDFEMCFAPQRRAIFLIWLAGSAPAALASLLFDPAEPQIIGKKQCFATFLPFRAPASSFFWLFLFSDLLSDSSRLCFSSVHIVGSLTSKLPSINYLYTYLPIYLPLSKSKSKPDLNLNRNPNLDLI